MQVDTELHEWPQEHGQERRDDRPHARQIGEVVMRTRSEDAHEAIEGEQLQEQPADEGAPQHEAEDGAP